VSIPALLSTLALATVGAADLPPGTELLDRPYLEQIAPLQSERAVVERVAVSGQPFQQAVRLTNRQRMRQFWDFQISVTVPPAVRKGEVMLVQFWARTLSSADETGEGRVEVYFQKNSPDFAKDLSKTVSVAKAWAPYHYPFVISTDRAAGETALCFGTGFNLQAIEIAAVRLLRFPAGVTTAQLPRTPVTYPGHAAEAPWRAAAAARIETHRKSDLSIRVTDAAGKPVPGAEVRIEMQRHAFPFGSIVSGVLLQEDETGQRYREKLLELFNSSGTENALKWPPWDGEWGPDFSRAAALKTLQWLKDNHFSVVRGHVMVWPGWDNLPKSLKELKEKDPQAVPERVREHIRDIATATRGLVDEWDVLNEPRANHDLMDLYGREIMADWFRCARAALPTADLYINDYSILNGDGPGSAAHDAYRQTIQFLLDQKAPVTGIGFQGHIGSSLKDPAQVYRTLEDFAQLGLKMRVTEFDVDIDDEQAQADYTRDFLTVLFSHPGVVGFQMWGFWEGSHWRPQGAMLRRNWEEKPNGKAYRDLVFGQWWTQATATTDAQGVARIRGFLGDYRVTANQAGATATTTAILPGQGAAVQITLK
jgi:GH35 family endo-1,4-beta-xylanase